MSVILDLPLTWRDVAAVAGGAPLALSEAADERLAHARAVVEAIVERGLKVYGVSTGVGALCDVAVPRAEQRVLSRNIVFSHAVGVGPALPDAGNPGYHDGRYQQLRPWPFRRSARPGPQLLALLNRGCTPVVPSKGSVGYISHMAHIGLVLMGEGSASIRGTRHGGREALAAVDIAPLVLDTKEGLSIVNGTPCATGLACLALARAEQLLDWADAAAALSFECLDGQITAFGAETMALQRSPGVRSVAARLRTLLEGSDRIAAAAGRRLQDALSLRAVPHVHGAARDAFDYAARVLDGELASVSDNPVVFGSAEDPRACSSAHAVGAGVALAMDTLGTAIAEVAAMSERRLDRLVNPLVNGMRPFLAEASGLRSGFMIAQYTAVSLVNENRRLAAPASLDGGITSGLQEDHLSHATPASLQALSILDNAARIVGLELMAGAEASDLHEGPPASGANLVRLHRRIRARVSPFQDDRPLASDLDAMADLVRGETFS